MPMILNIIYFALGIFIFNIIYISSIIYYLNQLKNCNCIEEKNKSNYTNINYLIIIESIILALNILYSLFMIILLYRIKGSKSGGAYNQPISNYITFGILLVIYGYFIYYVYKLRQNIQDCSCGNSWLRYLLYIQVILMIFGLFSYFMTLFN